MMREADQEPFFNEKHKISPYFPPKQPVLKLATTVLLKGCFAGIEPASFLCTDSLQPLGFAFLKSRPVDKIKWIYPSSSAYCAIFLKLKNPAAGNFKIKVSTADRHWLWLIHQRSPPLCVFSRRRSARRRRLFRCNRRAHLESQNSKFKPIKHYYLH